MALRVHKASRQRSRLGVPRDGLCDENNTGYFRHRTFAKSRRFRLGMLKQSRLRRDDGVERSARISPWNSALRFPEVGREPYEAMRAFKRAFVRLGLFVQRHRHRQP